RLPPQPAPIGSGGSGSASTSRTVQRRLVSPAAMAGVRCLLALRLALAATFNRLRELHTERLVRANEVVVGAPPFEVQEQLRRVLQRGPAAAHQRRYALPHTQIHALDKRGSQPAAQAQPLQGREATPCASPSAAPTS